VFITSSIGLKRMARVYSKRKDAERQHARITSQRGRPSWATGLTLSRGPTKRRAETDDLGESSKKHKNGRSSQDYWNGSDADADADGEVDDTNT
jgi:hypothetical protein